MANHSVPKASIDTLKEVIEGYYEAADSGELVEDEDVDAEIESSADVIRRQKRFFADIGLLAKEGHDYRLLPEGNKIGRALAFDREDEATDGLRDLLEDWEVTDQLIDDIGSNKVAEEGITDSLAYLTETDPSTARKKTGLAALVDLFVWTGILVKSEDGNYRVPDTQETNISYDETDTETESKEQNQSADSRTSDNGQGEEVRTVTQAQPTVDHSSNDGVLSINLELSGDEDPENVENLIIAVRRGLQSELVESQLPTENGETEEYRTLNSYDN